ncbi:MAG: nitrogenase component 1 [Bacillota bacterium]|nr:nitrogenase component 1 [Bacillota bacterium]
MSLCRLFPPFSDRMAIIWTLMSVRDAIVLEYGPAGTTHFGAGMYNSLGLDISGSIFTTHISEDDVVMGDVSRLENAIIEIDEAYSPKVIFVVASAVIAVIGTDIEGVCQYMQEKVKARLISFEEGGFRGDYTFGLRSVYKMLAKELVRTERKRPRTFAVLGASAGSYRVRSDVWEINSLMDEAFGWNNLYSMGLEASVDDLIASGDAALNLVIRNEALEAAKQIETNCGTPYLYGAPYGYAGTLAWLERVAAVIGEEINPKLRARLEEKIDDITPMVGGPMAMMRRKPPKACVQADYDVLLGMRQVLSELFFSEIRLLCSHSTAAVPNADAAVEYVAKEKDRIAIFRACSETWCLGSDEMKHYCDEDSFFTQLSAPFLTIKQVANHLPFMGEKGMDRFLELKADYFMKFGI